MQPERELEAQLLRGGDEAAASLPGTLLSWITTPTATAATSSEEPVVAGHGSLCAWPDCTRQLGLGVYRFYCRRCNGSYCAEHSGHPAMRIRLNEQGEWLQPGKEQAEKTLRRWTRVCSRCYENRPGYLLPAEPVAPRDHWACFAQARKEGQQAKHATRRLLSERWSQLEAYPGHGSSGHDWGAWQRSVVTWQPDTTSCTRCG